MKRTNKTKQNTLKNIYNWPCTKPVGPWEIYKSQSLQENWGFGKVNGIRHSIKYTGKLGIS